MTTALTAFLLALTITFVGTRLTIALSHRLGILDNPDRSRKLHKEACPTLGGPAIYLGFIAPILVLLWGYHNEVSTLLEAHRDKLTGTPLGALAALLTGTLDDIVDLRARWKLCLQCVVASIAFGFGLTIEAIHLPYVETFSLGPLALPITILWFLLCMNAVNLIDGLDGLAAGVSLIVVITLFIMCLIFENSIGLLLLACCAGALCGFLYLNFHPARIFLGDSGSLLVGFLIGAFPLMGATGKTETAIALLVATIALGLPIIDTALAILRRILRGLPLQTPDRSHIHHRLLSLGLSHKNVVYALYSAGVLLGSIALLLTLERNEVTILIFGSFGILLYVCIRVFVGVGLRDLLTNLEESNLKRREATNARIALSQSHERLERCNSTNELWGVVSGFLAEVGADTASLTLTAGDNGPETRYNWASPTDDNTADGATDEWTIQLAIQAAPNLNGILTVSTHQQDANIPTNYPDLLNALRKAVQQTLKNLPKDNGSTE